MVPPFAELRQQHVHSEQKRATARDNEQHKHSVQSRLLEEEEEDFRKGAEIPSSDAEGLVAWGRRGQAYMEPGMAVCPTPPRAQP